MPHRRNASVDNRIPMVVRLQVECANCGHAEDETFEFDCRWPSRSRWMLTSRQVAGLWRADT
jgi:hypothetical protein